MQIFGIAKILQNNPHWILGACPLLMAQAVKTQSESLI